MVTSVFDLTGEVALVVGRRGRRPRAPAPPAT